MTTLLAAIGALTALLVAAAGFVATLRNGKAQADTGKKQSDALGVVHVLVNSRMTDAMDRIEQLAKTLEDKGITVPPAAPPATPGVPPPPLPGGPGGP